MQNPLPNFDVRPPTCSKPRILKLRGDQERRRFFVGVSLQPCQNHIVATLVAATGRGLEARLAIASHVTQPIPDDLTAMLQTGVPEGSPPATLSRIAARLSDTAATAVEELAAVEQNVWPATLLCGILAPPDLLDATLLAEMAQMNVVDAFAARDIALNGSGQFLDALPLWILLRDTDRHRLVMLPAPDCRLLSMPPSRDERGAANVVAQQADDDADLWQRCFHQLQRTNATHEELLWLANAPEDCSPPDALLQRNPTLTLQTPETLGIAAESLPAASAAVLAMLHIDQTPGSLPHLTGASAPRVLGRLTPGSAKSWNRLLRDLAFSRPLVTPLRAAV